MSLYNPLPAFSRIPASLFQEWIDKKKEEAYKHLASSADPIAIHRAQGQVSLLLEMENLLKKSQDLR